MRPRRRRTVAAPAPNKASTDMLESNARAIASGCAHARRSRWFAPCAVARRLDRRRPPLAPCRPSGSAMIASIGSGSWLRTPTCCAPPTPRARRSHAARAALRGRNRAAAARRSAAQVRATTCRGCTRRSTRTDAHSRPDQHFSTRLASFQDHLPNRPLPSQRMRPVADWRADCLETLNHCPETERFADVGRGGAGPLASVKTALPPQGETR